MNVALSRNNKEDNIIEHIEERLSCAGKTTSVKWNRRGNYLLCGTCNGALVLWCFDTRQVIKEYRVDGDDQRRPGDVAVGTFRNAQEKAEPDAEVTAAGQVGQAGVVVRCVSWRRDNRKIAAGLSDGSVCVWDTFSGEMETMIKNVGYLNEIEFTKDFKALLVSPSGFKAPLFRGISKRASGLWGTGEKVVPVPVGLSEASVHGSQAILTKSGNYVIYALAGGALCVAKCGDPQNLELVQQRAIVGLNDVKMVKRLELARDGKTLLVVSFSRAIVAFDVNDDVEDKNKKDDVLAESISNSNDNNEILTNQRIFENKHSAESWESACVSFDNKFIYATSSRASHEIHCWNLKTLKLARVLEGPNEAKGLMRSCYHPKRHLMIGVGANGIMYVWAKAYEESWTAFQPDFQELKENTEYVEREDEFDIKDSDEEEEERQERLRKKKGVRLEDAEEISFEDLQLWKCDMSPYWSDHDEDVLHYLPVEIIPDLELQEKMAKKKKKWELKQKVKEEKRKEEKEKEKQEQGEQNDADIKDVDDESNNLIKKQKTEEVIIEERDKDNERKENTHI
jgi:WD40 repeat protein